LISAWFNQKRAIILAIQRQPGANVIETVQRVKAMMPVLQASIPAAVKVNVIFRSHPDHPRISRRRAIHAHADRRARGDGDFHIPS